MPELAVVDPSVVRNVGRPRRRRVWPWALGGGAAVALVAICLGLTLGQGTPAWDSRPVARGELVVTVTAVGTIEPLNVIAVGCDTSGIIEVVHVDANDVVTAGQPLAALDTTLLQAEIRRVEAAVRAAKASLASARITRDATQRELERTLRLAERGGVAASTLDQATAARDQAAASVDVARAQVEQALAAETSAETTLSRAVVVSPIDGVVLERSVEPGQAVVASLQVPTLFRVAEDLSRMSVEVDVDEADVGRVRAGQAATFTVAAYPDRVFEATVHQVDLAPTASQGVVTYRAALHLDNVDGLLRPGMTATATVVTDTMHDVLLVPNGALRFTPTGHEVHPLPPRDGRRAERVWVLDDGAPREVVVMPSVTDGTQTVVDGSLNPGDQVIVGVAEPK